MGLIRLRTGRLPAHFLSLNPTSRDSTSQDRYHGSCLAAPGAARLQAACGGYMMPIHDWTRLESGDFHHFHPGWVVNLTNELNSGLLPPEYMAMTEQVTGRPIPDVVALQTRTSRAETAGIAVAMAPPTARVIKS
jgi:hypothetical protein